MTSSPLNAGRERVGLPLTAWQITALRYLAHPGARLIRFYYPMRWEIVGTAHPFNPRVPRGTVDSLVRRRLIESIRPHYVITAAGRASLAALSATEAGR